MKILISGGHLTPALAVIDYILSQHPQDKIFFVGRLYSQPSLKQRALEKKEIEKRGIPFYALDAPKFNRSLWALLKLVSMIRSLWLARKIYRREKPDIFLSFGGYLAVPLAIMAFFYHLPIVTHEQTRKYGLANLLISKFAQLVTVSFPEAKEYFPRNKVKVIAFPLRGQIFNQETSSKPSYFNYHGEKKIILILGGNQGSEFINKIIAASLDQLIKKYIVIHQCGSQTSKHNYSAELNQQRLKLKSEWQNHYFIKEWIDAKEIAWFYQHCYFAISRSGANTVLELAAMQIPSIFIPLPFAYQDEQKANAQWLSDQQAALILAQKDLSTEKLLESIAQLERDYYLLKSKLKKLKIRTNGAVELYQQVYDLVNQKKSAD